jgi:hypothetical protein
MVRKLALTLVGATALGTAAMAPTSASAWGYGGWHGYHGGYGGWGYGHFWGFRSWGYGHGWCFWHPYACYRY